MVLHQGLRRSGVSAVGTEVVIQQTRQQRTVVSTPLITPSSSLPTSLAEPAHIPWRSMIHLRFCMSASASGTQRTSRFRVVFRSQHLLFLAALCPKCA